MKFEWDPEKNRINIRKHGIDFSNVSQMFDYPVLLRHDNRIDYGEDRWIGIGILNEIITVVVFTEIDEETLRIILVRKATKYEREKYQKEIAN